MDEFIHGLSNILHILAAITWIGSMIYSKFAVAPALKPFAPTKAQAINIMATKSFAPLTWTSLVILIATGITGLSINGKILYRYQLNHLG